MLKKTGIVALLFIFLTSLVVLPLAFANPPETGTEFTLTPAPKDRGLIESLKPDKNTITGPMQKMSSDLRGLLEQELLPFQLDQNDLVEQMKDLKQYVSAGEVVPSVKEKPQKDIVYLYIYMHEGELTVAIEPYAWKVVNRCDEADLVVAWVEVDRLIDLASLEGVRAVRTVLPPVTNSGSVKSEGDGLHQANLARSTFGVEGRGIKVGVISDGVDSWTAARDSGDLPADLVVLRNDIGGDEGTAMLEIIHDLAPGADLYFHDLGGDILSFNDAISALVTAGCDIIVDDIAWIGEPFFKDGLIAQHIANIIDNNDIIYISSAGNFARRHYQGQYYDLAAAPGWHDFSHGTDPVYPDLYAQIAPGETIKVILQWDDPWGASGNNYDMLLVYYDYVDDEIVFLGESDYIQDGSGDPLEFIIYTNPNDTFLDVEIWVQKVAGEARELEVYIYGAATYTNNIVPEDSIFGHPAVPGVIAVGAVDAYDPNNIADYSSLGPSTITFPSPEQRSKPDLCGIAGVSVTGAGGFPSPFFGTSAAAPHVAAIAALSWSAAPNLSGDEIRQVLLDTAKDMGTPGFNLTYGYGLADAFDAVSEAISISGPTFSDVPVDHPFYKEIEKLVRLGITTGFPDGTFRPSNQVTRMAMAAFLVRAFELDQGFTAPGEPTFTDVPLTHSFFDEIEALAASGITTGFPDGTFRPSNSVTRMATAAFLFRVLGLVDLEVTVPTFNDVPTTHPYFTEIEALAATGITTGFPDGTFRPSNTVTRQAMAAFLVRALELEGDVEIIIKDGAWYGVNSDFEEVGMKGLVEFYVKDNTITSVGSTLDQGAAWWLGFYYDDLYWFGTDLEINIENNEFGVAGTFDEGNQYIVFAGTFNEIDGETFAVGTAYHEEFGVRSMGYYWTAFHEDDLATASSMEIRALTEVIALEKDKPGELNRLE